jgi:hypothetical protein
MLTSCKQALAIALTIRNQHVQRHPLLQAIQTTDHTPFLASLPCAPQTPRGTSLLSRQEYAGLRETTEKRFDFDSTTIKRVVASCVLVPAFLYFMVSGDTEVWKHGLKGHTSGRRNIQLPVSADAAGAATEEEGEEEEE